MQEKKNNSNKRSTKSSKKTNKNDIIIPKIEELNIRGDNLVDDANSLFDYINRIDGKEFTLDTINRVLELADKDYI